jgi:hypothetical protein
MPKGVSKSTVAIQRLLDERQQIAVWLERLGMAADSTPDAVRAKVRSDYQRRMVEVMRELQAHGSELTGALERMRGTEAVLAKQEKAAAERLSEAELRHAVGEYDESQWRQVHADLLGSLVKVREALKQAGDEIKRLEEVMALIGSTATRPAARPAPPAAQEEAEEESEPAAPASAPGGAQGEALDELAFLRSVSEDDKQGPVPSRASGAMRAFEEPAQPAPANAASGGDAGGAGPKKEATRGGRAKSLKCKECGAMNLPTEWYCERCGAELAAL